MDQVDYALLALRLWAGVVIILHGVNHARSLDGTARWFASVGFRYPKLNAAMSAFMEIAVGIGLIAGMLTSAAAAGLAATMFVAFWAIHRFAGFFVFHRPDEGYEYVATLTVIALALAIAGPGAASVDRALGIDETLSGWTGLLIFFGGIALAAVELAVLWRKPIKETSET